MKKTILMLGLLSLSAGAWAQKSKVRTAREYLEENNYKKAIAAINEAVVHEDTKNSADAWYWRGVSYLTMAIDTSAKSTTAGREAVKSFMQALAINPNYGPEINLSMHQAAIVTFNEGIADFSSKSYDNAYQKFMQVNEMFLVGGGKRHAENAQFKSLAENARLYASYAALNDKQYDKALPLLVDIKNTQAEKDSNVYQSLVEIYQAQNNDNQMLATIAEARKHFPNNQLFRNLELNYYIRTGKQSELMPKLEAAVKQDPNNPELLFNLANGYEKVANPTDAAGKDLPRPGNADEMVAKAEEAYKNAIRLNPDNPDYNYNLAVLYYKSAGAFNRQLSEIKGMSAAEEKKYKEIQTKRDAEFDKALPYFEKAYSLLDAQGSKMDPGMKGTYKNSMIGLREIYSRKGNKAKTEELKAKIDAVK